MCSNKLPLLNPLFHFCIACTTCIITTIGLHPCMQPCKQGEWGEQVHLSCGSPLGFGWYSQSLDLSLKMLNVYLIFIFCVLCTLFSHYYLCKHSPLWEEELNLYLTACTTQILHTTRSRLPHNALHSPSNSTTHCYNLVCVRTATVVVAICSATFQFLQSARVATTAVKVIFTLTKYTQNMVAIWHMCSNVLASFPG